MPSPWSSWSCCGILPFGRPVYPYEPLDDPLEGCPERWRLEIDRGLPSGVTLGDIVQANVGAAALHQTYLLAVQSNRISEYLKRFDVSKVPTGCQETVRTQVKKLQSIQNVVWNTMLALAVGEITVDDSALQSLLSKRAGECVSLMELEKLATAMAADDSVLWATEISHTFSEPTSAAPPTTIIAEPPARGQTALISDNLPVDALAPLPPVVSESTKQDTVLL
ncbi:ORF55 [Retroperitoneal fibromatosis-associated herpesvirus]|uniref:ORF55 n=1 Tax=Retroperitoneal fibromatosis-associated herpesvirus TaxID=111469 RepID=U5NM29_9GAMA|nr:ORF55 [Retroperitoneal fibromatosis-associated herpesvirus]AGY30737.1 ORF55 [Retroperitoneal fibromatosis-associated herpesvirus]